MLSHVQNTFQDWATHATGIGILGRRTCLRRLKLQQSFSRSTLLRRRLFCSMPATLLQVGDHRGFGRCKPRAGSLGAAAAIGPKDPLSSWSSHSTGQGDRVHCRVRCLVSTMCLCSGFRSLPLDCGDCRRGQRATPRQNSLLGGSRGVRSGGGP